MSTYLALTDIHGSLRGQNQIGLKKDEGSAAFKQGRGAKGSTLIKTSTSCDIIMLLMNLV